VQVPMPVELSAERRTPRKLHLNREGPEPNTPIRKSSNLRLAAPVSAQQPNGTPQLNGAIPRKANNSANGPRKLAVTPAKPSQAGAKKSIPQMNCTPQHEPKPITSAKRRLSDTSVRTHPTATMTNSTSVLGKRTASVANGPPPPNQKGTVNSSTGPRKRNGGGGSGNVNGIVRQLDGMNVNGEQHKGSDSGTSGANGIEGRKKAPVKLRRGSGGNGAQ
jgi:hypothetical protein